MKPRPADIVHQGARHWIARVANGFEVYREEGTHSVRCAVIGFTGARGLERAIAEVQRREGIG